MRKSKQKSRRYKRYIKMRIKKEVICIMKKTQTQKDELHVIQRAHRGCNKNAHGCAQCPTKLMCKIR